MEGRPRAHPRATEAWRTGCGVAKGWAQKRAHRGGRARAEEVCTRVTWPFCQGLPQRGRPPALWGLGNEEHGLDPAVAAACSRLVTLPGAGRVESLNVSVAAGILIWEAWARRS